MPHPQMGCIVVGFVGVAVFYFFPNLSHLEVRVEWCSSVNAAPPSWVGFMALTLHTPPPALDLFPAVSKLPHVLQYPGKCALGGSRPR